MFFPGLNIENVENIFCMGAKNTRVGKGIKMQCFFFHCRKVKRPFELEPECCPCAMVREEVLSPGGDAYSPTDHHHGDVDDDDDDENDDDDDDDDDVDSCCKTLSSAAKRTFGFC